MISSWLGVVEADRHVAWYTSSIWSGAQSMARLGTVGQSVGISVESKCRYKRDWRRSFCFSVVEMVMLVGPLSGGEVY